MLRNQTEAHSPPQPCLCTNFKDIFASTELPSFCHQQQNFYKNGSGSNLTSPQAPNLTAILLLSYQHLPIVELKSFLRTLSPVRDHFPEVGISTCHVSMWKCFKTLLTSQMGVNSTTCKELELRKSAAYKKASRINAVNQMESIS